MQGPKISGKMPWLVPRVGDGWERNRAVGCYARLAAYSAQTKNAATAVRRYIISVADSRGKVNRIRERVSSGQGGAGYLLRHVPQNDDVQ
jgi:hypothetical protein